MTRRPKGGPPTMVYKIARKTAEGASLLVNGQVFNDLLSTLTSGSTPCDSFDQFTLLVTAQVSGTPTKIRITPEFSWDGGVTWWSQHLQPAEIIEFEDSEVAEAGTLRKSYNGVAPGYLMRVRVDAYGVGASDTFTISVSVWFRS